MNQQQIIAVDDERLLTTLFGNLDELANIIENKLHVILHNRNSNLVLSGSEVSLALATRLIAQIEMRLQTTDSVDSQALNYMIDTLLIDSDLSDDYYQRLIMTTHKGDRIVPKSQMQANYVKAIEQADVVFGLGPAGTGKTFIAVAMAARYLKQRKVDKIIITRPAVEAGESLGFLPGDLQQKIEPYLKPIDDALNKILGQSVYGSYWDKGAIEIVPLAYMRGRTLEKAFIILDEAQNASIEQMKMFLTRFGKGSKVVVNGDTTQIDLSNHQQSGLVHAVRILSDVEGIRTVTFEKRDVIRHHLVMAIIDAYNKQGES